MRLLGKARLLTAAGLALALLLPGPFAPAQPAETAPPPPAAGALTLPEAVREALRRRPLLAADEARTAAAQARVTQAHAALLPRVEFQGSVTDGPLGAPPLG